MKFKNTKLNRFFSRQIDAVKEEGLFILVIKTWRRLRSLFFLISTMLCVPIVLVIRVLKPFVLFRFGPLKSDRIGHFARNSELYLCQFELVKNRRKIIDLFYHTYPISNEQLKVMLERKIKVWDMAYFFDRANRLFSKYEEHVIPMPKALEEVKHGLITRCREPKLSFSSKEEQKGYDSLKKMGVPKNAPFICLYTRDSGYLQSVVPKGYWSYHSYRDSRVHNYLGAAEELVCRGYYVIRMGAVVKERIKSCSPKIIDYANSHRSDFMDIFLCAKCSFLLGSTGGLNSVTRIFRKPVVCVDFIPVSHLSATISRDLIVPKKLYFKKEARFMTFKEIFDSKVRDFIKTEQYEEAGIRVVDNTADEIRDAAIEMDERLNDRWEEHKEDEELALRFWDSFGVLGANKDFFPKISTDFLRKNQDLILSSEKV